MTIFRSRGFDSLIGKDTTITGAIRIATGSTMQIDGHAFVTLIEGNDEASKVNKKTTLHVAGEVNPVISTAHPMLNIQVHNVIVTGKVTCSQIRVEGTLAIKSGAHLRADKIYYRELIIETGAVVHGQMFHLDHVSEGEQV